MYRDLDNVLYRRVIKQRKLNTEGLEEAQQELAVTVESNAILVWYMFDVVDKDDAEVPWRETHWLIGCFTDQNRAIEYAVGLKPQSPKHIQRGCIELL